MSEAPSIGVPYSEVDDVAGEVVCSECGDRIVEKYDAYGERTTNAYGRHWASRHGQHDGNQAAQSRMVPDENDDSLLRSWNEVVSLQQSAAQFNGRLVRTAPVVAGLAASYPALRDAVKAVNVLIANLDLARDVLGRAAPPDPLLKRAT